MTVIRSQSSQTGQHAPHFSEGGGELVLVTNRSGSFLSETELASLEDCFPSRIRCCLPANAHRLISELNPSIALVEVDTESGHRVIGKLCESFPKLVCVALVRGDNTNSALQAMREGAADVICLDSEEDLGEILKNTLRRAKRNALRARGRARNSEVEQVNTVVEGELILGTSHDLKGTLGVILTSAELLEKLPVDPERTRQLTACIASSARGVITILDSIVSAQRMHDGAFVLNKEWINLTALIQELCEDYRIVADINRVKLSAEKANFGHKVWADKIAVMRIVSNLIQNAIKYTQPGGEVLVLLRKRKERIEISVRDTGRGIPKDRLKQIFDRYARLPEHRKLEGTGLGLYVSNALAEAHGGRLRVRSKRGVGSVFTVQLPVLETDPFE